MKNWEKYEEALKEIGFEVFAISNGNVRSCTSISCADCGFNGGGCSNKKIKWLYDEADKPKATKGARKFLELVETGYIARDKDGEINWFQKKPYRCSEHWAVDINSLGYCLDLKTINMEREFDFIMWEDESWSVEDLLMLESIE